MADANIKAVITAEDKASGVIQNFGLSFGKMTAAVVAGQAIFAGATTALHLVEDGFHTAINVIEDSINTTMDLGRQTLTLQRNFGLTAEQASGLVDVFNRFGLNADDASRAFTIFEKHLVNIKDPESIGVSAINLLGVKTTDATGNLRSMNDVLFDVADKFKNGAIPATERAAVAMELFGRAGTSLMPILLQGSEGIAALEEHAKKMGLVLSQDNVDAIRKNMAAQKDLNEAISGVKVQIGNALMPVITNLIENHLMKWIEANGGVAQIMQEKVIPVIHEVIEWLKQHKQTFLDVIQAAKDFGTFIAGVFKFVEGTYHFFHDDLAGVIYDVISWFQQLPGHIANALKDLGRIILAPFTWAFNEIKRGIDDVQNAFNRVKDDVGAAPGHVTSGISGLLHKIPGFADGGTVPGPTGAPMLAVVHGGERVIPNSGNRPAGGTVNISVNVGVFAGTQMELRKLATALQSAYQDAQSMGTQ